MARLFVAVEVAPEVVAQLQRAVPASRGIRAVPAEQAHLTLRFLGECDAGQCERIEAALSGVRAAPFALQVQGAGRFRGRQGCVLWAGLAPVPALDSLYDTVSAALREAGIAPERRPFHPHLTVARCRPFVPEAVIRDWLAAWRTLSSMPWQVDWFLLFESFLSPEGASHLIRHAWPLAMPRD